MAVWFGNLLLSFLKISGPPSQVIKDQPLKVLFVLTLLNYTKILLILLQIASSFNLNVHLKAYKHLFCLRRLYIWDLLLFVLRQLFIVHYEYRKYNITILSNFRCNVHGQQGTSSNKVTSMSKGNYLLSIVQFRIKNYR